MSLQNTFPKVVRLHNSRAIREVFEQGVYQSLGPIGVKYKMAETESSRFSISVKKKVGNAPCRNQIKRFIREAVRKERAHLNYSFDICFFVTNPPKHKLASAYVLRQVRRFFNEINHDSSNWSGRYEAEIGSAELWNFPENIRWQDFEQFFTTRYGGFHQRIPLLAFTAAAGFLQILSKLFSLCAGILPKTWFLEGDIFEPAANFKM
jgi:ribonuclease P protein component